MADEPTPSELYRLVERVDKKLDKYHEDAVGSKQYEADQRGIDRRFEESNRVHAEMKALLAQALTLIDAVDDKHDAENKELVKRQDTYEKDQQSQKSQKILTWMGWIASPIIATILTTLFKGS